MSLRLSISVFALITGIFASLPFTGLAGQDSLVNSRHEPNYFLVKSLYENPASEKESRNEESDSWIKRWLWNNRFDINPDGSFKNDYNNYNQNINRGEKHSPDKLQSQPDWIPVGPVNLPPSYEPRSCYGMGRINCVAFHPADSNIFWIGTPGGGVWKTENHGKSWIPLTDDLPTLAVSSIAVDPTNPDIIYFASGDFDGTSIRMYDVNAQGVFKTTNGGISWTKTSLQQAKNFGFGCLRTILINPKNTNELIAAGSYGIWKSSDAGNTWKFIKENLVTDMEPDPSNSNILYAAAGNLFGYYGSAGVMKSTDFGETWDSLNTNIPNTGVVYRVEIAVSPADPNYIYAITVSELDLRRSGLYKIYQSTDAGKTWHVNADAATSTNILGAYNGDYNDLNGQGEYDLVLLADPKDKNKVYAGGVNLWMTEDGGKNWDIAGFWIYVFGRSIHADHHFAAYNPLDHSFYWCNDGGIARTKEILPGSKDWITEWIDRYTEDAKPGHPDFKFPTVWEELNDGLSITEFYRVSLAKNKSGYVSGGSQDNSCFYNNNGDWVNYIANYDGMETMIDYNNPQTIYGVWQGGGLCKSTDGGKTIKTRLSDTIISKLEEQGNWITPVAMDPVNPDIIYMGFRNLWRSRNGGLRWDKALNLDSLFVDDTTSNSNSISIVKTSYNDPDCMAIYKESYWIYIDNTNTYKQLPGELWITNDGGKTWKQAKENLPLDSMNIVSLEYDLNNSRIMWAAFYSGHPEINTFMSTDGGNTWKDVSKPLYGERPNVLVHQYGGEMADGAVNNLYIGTNHGVYYTNEKLNQWMPYGENLPNVIVRDLEIDNNSKELYAATYGRGIWKAALLPVGVDEQSAINTSLSVSPNPSKGNFRIDFKSVKLQAGTPVSIKLFDIAGRIAYQSEDVATGNDNFAKELRPNLENGVYFVQLTVNGRNYAERVVIR